LQTKAAELPSLEHWLNTSGSSIDIGSDVPHEHSAVARLIALEEDKAEMLSLFQQIYDSLAEGANEFQAKSLAYAALRRYGAK
jgi:hypothetical protein